MVKMQQKLVQLVRRWKAAALRHRAAAVSDISVGAAAAIPVPAGYLAVYVGLERRRFVIPTRFLSFPVFSALLSLAEEEFGFAGNGGLVLPCTARFFRRVLEILDADETRFRDLNLEGFVELSGLAGPETLSSCISSCCREKALSQPLAQPKEAGF